MIKGIGARHGRPRGHADQETGVEEPLAGSAATAHRPARRLRLPGWRDLRLLVGVLLVVLSVIGVHQLVRAQDRTTPIYAAAVDLLPGQPVTADQLTVVDVRLADSAAAYLDGAVPLADGTHAVRAVPAGELVPAAALGTARQALDKTVRVPLDPVSATGLVAGSVVDVWVSRRDPDVVGEAFLDPEQLLGGAVVDEVPGAGGGLGGVGATRASVSVVVPADRVGEMIGVVDQGARITLVPAPRGAAPEETR